MNGVGFYACLKPVCPSWEAKTASAVPRRRIGQIQAGLWDSEARAILRLWVLNKRRCYFWHLRRDLLHRPDKLFYDLSRVLSIVSAPLQSAIPLDDYGPFVTRSICGYTPNLLWRTPEPMRVGGVSPVKINIKRCDTSRLTPSEETVAKIGNIYINRGD